LELDLPAEGVRIVGPNGSGKTTIIESILLLSTTKSRRGAQDADLVQHGAGVELGVAPYGRVVGHIDRSGVAARIEVFVEQDTQNGLARKVIKVGDRPRRAAEVVGLLPTVSFSPEDLELTIGSPAVRRRFLDVVLSQTDRQYLRFLSRYNRVLSQRNGLLRRTGQGRRVDRSEFDYWDEQVVGLGSQLIAARARAIALISEHVTQTFSGMAPGAGELAVAYLPSLSQPEGWWETLRDTDDQVDAVRQVSLAYEQQLRRSFEQDLSRSVTTLGPHRDDLQFLIDDREIARFGSRGQQRVAVVALKLAEMEVIWRSVGVRPVFLLDDVLSELDPEHRERLIQAARSSGSQLIVTATDRELLKSTVLEALAETIIVRPGVVETTAT
jgi:DNA replication and repair protein RecF